MSIMSIIASIARTRPMHTPPLCATIGSDELTSTAIVDQTPGDLAKTPRAASSGTTCAVRHYVGDPPIHVPTRTDATIGALIQGVISQAAMGSAKRQKTVGLHS